LALPLHFANRSWGCFLETIALILCCTGRLALVFAEWGIGHALLSVEDAALGGEVSRAAEGKPEESALYRSRPAVHPLVDAFKKSRHAPAEICRDEHIKYNSIHQ
jgi:hypothetical protein